MSLILIISILIRLIAMAWSIVLLSRTRDGRMGFLTVLLALMATRQTFTLLETRESLIISITAQATELPGLIVSVMAFLAVFFVENFITERKRAEARIQHLQSVLAAIRNADHRLRGISLKHSQTSTVHLQ